MPQKIYYWRDARGDHTRFSNYRQVIDRLLEGDHKGLHLEKLRGLSGGPPLYSIRVNQETRLLFTTYNTSIFLCDVVLNHDYHKSRFLQPKFLKHFLSSLSDGKSGEVIEVCQAPAFELVKQGTFGLGVSGSSQCSLAPLELYQTRFIALSTTQEQVLQTQLPALVRGPAGSGKTCVAISVLLQQVRRYAATGSRLPVIYISQSAHLVKAMKEFWQDSVSAEVLPVEVLFRTYQAFLREYLPTSISLADDTVFESWYVNQKKMNMSWNEVWREFRIRSGYTEAQYCALGQRQSSMDASQRQEVCCSYSRYLTYLISENLFSPELQPLPAYPTHGLVVVDEAQDFSYGQLRELATLAENSAVIYLLGEHQVLFDGKSRLSFLKNMFYEYGRTPSEITLRETYRCPQRVTDVANQLIHLKYQVTGGSADKDETCEMSSGPHGSGEAAWLLPTDQKGIDALKPEAQYTHFAVVTHPEYMEEARGRFETPLIFTVEAIKGLEYESAKRS